MRDGFVVEIRGLRHRFGVTQVLDRIDLSVDAPAPGQVACSVCIIGPNGAGKTTLFDILTGFVQPCASAIVNVLGKPVHGLQPEAIARRGVARSFQGATDVVGELTVDMNLSLLPWLTAIPWWKRLVRLRSWRRAEDSAQQRIRSLLVELGCEELLPRLDLPAGSLSYGWRRVVSVLRLHLSESRLLLLDEPFAGLDPHKVRLLQQLIGRWRRQGRSVVFIEHIRSSAMRTVIEETANRLVLVEGGRILLDGTPAEVLSDRRFAHAYTGVAIEHAQTSTSPKRPALAGQHTAPSVLEFRGIRASYNGLPVLHGINTTVREGEYMLIVGPNGAGKSTLLGAVHRIGEHVEGEVRLRGANLLNKLAAHKVAKLGVAFVPQRHRIFPDLTVGRNLLIAASTVDRSARPHRLREVLELFPALQVGLQQKAGTLSGGEQTQLAIAMALVRHPVVLLADEISIGLDSTATRALVKALRERVEQGLALVSAEQVYQAALERCHYILALRDGRVFWEGPPEDFNDDIQARLFSGIELRSEEQ
jgi:ABC-type branched-subunit amino acid transport system ATPase component